MKKYILILAGLLLFQFVLVIFLQMTQKEYNSFEADKTLLPFDPLAVAKIRMEGPDGKVILLQKVDNHWIMPDHYRFPAGSSEVRDLLDKLAGLKKGWPVASTTAAAKRFKVSPDLFERRIVLSGHDNNVLAELFVGTSPGFRKVHVRPAGEDDIVAVQFSTFAVGLRPEDWIDKDVLKLEEDSITAIDMPGFTLKRTGERLTVTDLGKDEEEIEEQIKTLTRRIADLKIESVLGVEDKPEYHQDRPELIVKVTRKTGETREYVFAKMEKEDFYVLKTSDRKNYFKVVAWQVDLIKETNREKLVRKKDRSGKSGSENNGEGRN